MPLRLLDRDPGWRDQAPPEPDTRGYKRIAIRGCDGEPDSLGAMYCDYPWSCSACPVTREADKSYIPPNKRERLYRFLHISRKSSE